MRRFDTTAETSASSEQVWQVMSDVERWHEWTESITGIKALDGGPLAVGRRYITRQPKLPPALWKVTEVRTGERFTWVSTAPGLRVIATHAVSSTPTGSRITLSIDIDGLLGGLWGRITRGITERYLALEARGLKARTESIASAPPAGAA